MAAVRKIVSSKWFEPAATPLYAIVGTVLCIGVGAMWNASRQADVVWRHHTNPHPWLDVEPESEVPRLFHKPTPPHRSDAPAPAK